MPECNSLHIMRTLYLCDQGVRGGVTSEARMWLLQLPEAECRRWCKQRLYETLTTRWKTERYFARTSLAMVASCMFEVPS